MKRISEAALEQQRKLRYAMDIIYRGMHLTLSDDGRAVSVTGRISGQRVVVYPHRRDDDLSLYIYGHAIQNAPIFFGEPNPIAENSTVTPMHRTWHAPAELETFRKIHALLIEGN